MSPPERGPRILIVEDEYFIADDLARELARLGAEIVATVPSLDRALRVVGHDAASIDAAVVNLDLRGEAAYPAIADLDARGIRVLICTGFSQRDLPQELAAYPFFEKPADPAALLAAARGAAVKTGGAEMPEV